MTKTNVIIHQNIERVLLKIGSNVSTLKNSLYAFVEKDKVDSFFSGTAGCDDVLLVALSKVLKVNTNFFFESFERKCKCSDIIKENKLLSLFEILNIEDSYTEDNLDSLILKYTKAALKSDLVSISYAAYLLNADVQTVMELDYE